MDAPQPRHYTLQEYFDLEANSPERWEYRDGKVLCMSDGSVQPSLIIANVVREIGNRLKGSPCYVYSERLRVRIARRTLYSHPDVTVIAATLNLIRMTAVVKRSSTLRWLWKFFHHRRSCTIEQKSSAILSTRLVQGIRAGFAI